jgi:hypothetical protein
MESRGMRAVYIQRMTEDQDEDMVVIRGEVDILLMGRREGRKEAWGNLRIFCFD